MLARRPGEQAAGGDDGDGNSAIHGVNLLTDRCRCGSGFETPCLTVGLTAHVRERPDLEERVKRVRSPARATPPRDRSCIRADRLGMFVLFEACVVESIGEGESFIGRERRPAAVRAVSRGRAPGSPTPWPSTSSPAAAGSWAASAGVTLPIRQMPYPDGTNGLISGSSQPLAGSQDHGSVSRGCAPWRGSRNQTRALRRGARDIPRHRSVIVCAEHPAGEQFGPHQLDAFWGEALLEVAGRQRVRTLSKIGVLLPHQPTVGEDDELNPSWSRTR